MFWLYLIDHASHNTPMPTRELILDLGSSPTLHIKLSDDLQGATQVNFVGYYIRNANAEDIRVRIHSSNVHFHGPITNEANSSNGVFIASPVSATGQYVQLTESVPMLSPGNKLSTNSNLHCVVQTWAGADVTFSRLILFFTVDYPDVRDTHRFEHMHKIDYQF